MTYEPDLAGQFWCVANCIDKALKGVAPDDLQLGQATRYARVINPRTDEAARLTIPQSIALQASEAIR